MNDIPSILYIIGIVGLLILAAAAAGSDAAKPVEEMMDTSNYSAPQKGAYVTGHMDGTNTERKRHELRRWDTDVDGWPEDDGHYWCEVMGKEDKNRHIWRMTPVPRGRSHLRYILYGPIPDPFEEPPA